LRARWIRSGERYRSIADPASAFAATIIPFSPMLIPVQATICQLWPGAP